MQQIRRYAVLSKNRSNYFVFGKQLAISEIAGLVMGVIVAEISTYFFYEKKADISLYSGIADYSASIVGFFVIHYHDSRRYYTEYDRLERFIKVLKSMLRIWPTVVIADVAYIFCRPYIQYLLLTYGLESGVAATIAHFIAFGIFNAIAIFSKSIADYASS